MASGATSICNLFESDDIRYIKNALDALQITYSQSDGVATVTGSAGIIPVSDACLYLCNAVSGM